MSESLMLFEAAKPAWLLLLIVVVLGFVFRKRRSYIGKVFTKGRKAKRRFRSFLPLFFGGLALLSIAAALSDITRAYTLVEEMFNVNRILISVDNSGSMYYAKPPSIYCTDEKLATVHPKISSVCRALHYTIDAAEAFAQKKGKGAVKNKIGILRFADYSFAQVYPTSDYDRVRKAVDEVNWTALFSLGYGTNIEYALWDLYRTAFERNAGKDGGYTYLSPDDIGTLVDAVSFSGWNASLYVPEKIRGKMEPLKKEMRDTVFVIITDAAISSFPDTRPVSMRKMLELASLLEIPVYFISVEKFSEEYLRLARDTGFGPPGGKYRGDFLLFDPEGGARKIETLLGTILEARFGRTTSHTTPRRESYAEALSLAGLIFLLISVLLRETISRSLTDV